MSLMYPILIAIVAAQNPAEQTLARMTKTYQNLTSYSAKVGLRVTLADGKERTLLGQIALAQPGKLAVAVFNNKNQLRTKLTFDGNTCYVLNGPRPRPAPKSNAAEDANNPPAMLPASYQRLLVPARPGDNPLSGMLARSGIIGPEFAQALTGDTLIKSLKEQGMQSLNQEENQTIGGIAMDIVVAQFASHGKAGRTLTFAIGHEDHLLHQITSDATNAQGQTTRRVESHWDIALNSDLPSAWFVFTPPAGAVALADPAPLPELPVVSSLAANAPPLPKEFTEPNGIHKMRARQSKTPTADTSAIGAIPVFQSGKKADAPNASDEAPARPSSATGLDVSPLDGVTNRTVAGEMASNAGSFNFGALSVLDQTTVEKVFTLKNSGTAPLTILQLQPSCGCISALLEKEQPAPGSETVLAPGDSIGVRVKVNLNGLPPGLLGKSVLVVTREHPETASAILTMTGILQPTIAFSPSEVTFGTVNASDAKAGTGRTIEVTATPDGRLIKDGASIPTLAAQQPGIVVTPLGKASDQPGSYRYRVMVAPDAPLGILTVNLGFAPATASNPEEVRRAMAWRSATLTATASVQGDVSAAPGLIAFGLSHPATATQRVTLTGKTAAALSGMTVTSETPALTARIVPPDKDKPLQATLEVTVARDAPLGALQSRLIVTLANGQRLLIPVSAYVAPTATATNGK